MDDGKTNKQSRQSIFRRSNLMENTQQKMQLNIESEAKKIQNTLKISLSAQSIVYFGNDSEIVEQTK